MKHIVLLAIGLSLALPLQAGKQHAGGKGNPKPNHARVFKKKDKNHDGFLSKEEFVSKVKKSARAEKAFAKKDKDSDGKISRAEFTGKEKKRNANKNAGKKHKASKKSSKKNQ